MPPGPLAPEELPRENGEGFDDGLGLGWGLDVVVVREGAVLLIN